MRANRTFDDWPERYDAWFGTPIGELIFRVESRLVNDMLDPKPGDRILDAGCGTGMFTRGLFLKNVRVAGLELSAPMLMQAERKLPGRFFLAVQGDMTSLPFSDHAFDRAVSVTAIEFIADADQAVAELFRVTRPGGRVVVATLNSLSPWADRRRMSGEKGHPIFKHVFFRSPEDLRGMFNEPPMIRTAVHFEKHADPLQAERLEKRGTADGLQTGAFLVAAWDKPARLP